jgi:hypothetical protein
MRVRLRAVFDFAPAVLLLAAGLASDASAQSTPRRQSPAQRQSRPAATQPAPQRRAQAPLESEADANADVAITARVTADSLRFEKVPNPQVEFTGRPRRETVWESERENLPPQVRPGETYRNVGITLRIRSVFADIDRIVAEALGEVPLTDDAPTPSPPQTQQSPPSVSATPSPTTPPAKSSTTTRPRRRPARGGRGK